MHFFTNITPGKRKQTPGSETSVLKFSLALLLGLGIISFIAWQRVQHNQTIRELRKELATQEKHKEELLKNLQNRSVVLEQLMEGGFIAAKAKPLGLRPPTPKQRVVQLKIVRTERGLEAQPKVARYTR